MRPPLRVVDGGVNRAQTRSRTTDNHTTTTTISSTPCTAHTLAPSRPDTEIQTMIHSFFRTRITYVATWTTTVEPLTLASMLVHTCCS
ncbi:hypothetical protein K431DRAFT_282481 [Polychaeton citri CBS 116435]|uniref:Uncharacterized protein n=1 Tax=Polychaeton citri CBS 116435 TaxID=1314669 RepID=A0A9P4QFJ6_9PEZI|nr:hypothetical protein K431DRAFT_282481 [Polychaeton citri CBS 116435]